MTANTEAQRCDCLNDCGDDNRIKLGTIQPCDWLKAQRAEREALEQAVAEMKRKADLHDGLQAEVARLNAIVNMPHTDDFLRATSIEAEHQVQRWGTAHDRSKSAENWFWLGGYLAGKCLRACLTGDKEKALHHTISTAAALKNWFDAIKADESGSGIGSDADLVPLAAKKKAQP